MKKNLLFVVVLTFFITGCSLFERPGDGNPIAPQEQFGKSTMLTLTIDRSALGLHKISWTDSLWFHGNCFLNSAQTATEVRETLIGDSLKIMTAVNEKANGYMARVMTQTGYLLNGFHLATVTPKSYTLNENEGPYFYFGVNPSGALIQGSNTLQDTVRIKVRLYAADNRTFNMNGTMTRFRNVRLTKITSPKVCYEYEFLTLSGIQKYDIWESGGNSSIDSCFFGSARITDISGSHIRFNVSTSGITILDSLANMNKLSVLKTKQYEQVKAYIYDGINGNRTITLVDNGTEYASSLVIADNVETDVRLEGYTYPSDTTALFLNVHFKGTKLHHLELYANTKYRFRFKLNGETVVQDTNNVILALGTKP